MCDGHSCDELEKIPIALGAKVLLIGPFVGDPTYVHTPMNVNGNPNQKRMIDVELKVGRW